LRRLEYSALDSHWNASSHLASRSARRVPQTHVQDLTQSHDYRKRAAAIGKRLRRKGDAKSGCELLRRKRQALLALTDNEDWLAAV
jgi:hypothetical protein